MKDGGPAFPATRAEEIPIAQSENLTDWADVTYPGMSLRDWFAGQALAGCAVDDAEPNWTAKWCYRVADAMLAAREAQREEDR